MQRRCHRLAPAKIEESSLLASTFCFYYLGLPDNLFLAKLFLQSANFQGLRAEFYSREVRRKPGRLLSTS